MSIYKDSEFGSSCVINLISRPNTQGNLDVYRLHRLPLANINRKQRLKRKLKQHRKEKLATATFNRNDELKKLMEIQATETSSRKTFKTFTPLEAFEEIEKQYKSKIDESIDMCMKLGIDSKKSDQQVRGIVVMPSGTGREVKIAIFTSQENMRFAEKAGADMIIGIDVIKDLDPEKIPFDKLIATSDVIKNLKPFGRTIGPLGLMPNAKSGTLVEPSELESTVKNFKEGRIEVKNDNFSIIHACIGKRRFTKEQLLINFQAIVRRLQQLRPEKQKGEYFVWCKISRSKGPSLSIKVDSLFADSPQAQTQSQSQTQSNESVQ